MTDVAGLSQIGSWHPEAITVAERELPAYLLRQRWYPAKDAVTPTVSLQKLIPMEEGDGNSAMAVWNISAEGREPFSIFFPVAVVDQAGQEDLAGPVVVARLPDGRTLVDATERDSFVKALVLRILHSSRQQSSSVTTGHTHHIAALEDTPQATWQVKRSSVEQSNTSIRLADKSILKVIRKLSPGIHPELEMPIPDRSRPFSGHSDASRLDRRYGGDGCHFAGIHTERRGWVELEPESAQGRKNGG